KRLLGGESRNSWISRDSRYHRDLKAQRSKKLWRHQAIFESDLFHFWTASYRAPLQQGKNPLE
ncbi:MAG: hypothetical protein Q8M34_10585, partial [Thermodesulfovibrionales bacterium]|nr:hypothetical protein [Thermodesulfovibrionales bacterium]